MAHEQENFIQGKNTIKRGGGSGHNISGLFRNQRVSSWMGSEHIIVLL
jgi:hypothetical protein